MRTPAGKECKYFYGDYYRGRNYEECRLLKSHNLRWTPDLCRTCPVPGIQNANACEFLQVWPSVVRSLWTGFQRRVQVRAYCQKTRRDVAEPHIGCGECHTLPFHFEVKE